VKQSEKFFCHKKATRRNKTCLCEGFEKTNHSVFQSVFLKSPCSWVFPSLRGKNEKKTAEVFVSINAFFHEPLWIVPRKSFPAKNSRTKNLPVWDFWLAVSRQTKIPVWQITLKKSFFGGKDFGGFPKCPAREKTYPKESLKTIGFH